MKEEKQIIIKRILKEYFDGGLPEDVDELVQGWLSESGDELKEDELEALYDRMVGYDRAPGREAYDSLKTVRAKLGFPSKRISIPLRKRFAFKVAAVLIPFVILTASILFLSEKWGGGPTGYEEVKYVQVSVPAVGRQQVVLPDGSVVRIKEGSSVEYAEDFLANRSVKLNGEAFFKVMKMDGAPFVVDAGDVSVKVLGTEFNVRSAAGEAQAVVTLAKGKVEVVANHGATVLEPMQQFVYDRLSNERSIEAVFEDDIRDMSGTSLYFYNTPLDEVFRRLEKHYDVNIDVAGTMPAGVVRVDFEEDDNLRDVLFVLKNATKTFDYTIYGNVVVITALQK